MFPKVKKSKKVIYLDHAATTYIDPMVVKAMEPFWKKQYGNPSSLYSKGREAADAVAAARKSIAKAVNARPEEIIFTAGGTESVNLAIFGVARKLGQPTAGNKYHFLASAVEHHAVLHSFEALNRQEFNAQMVEVDETGLLDLDTLKAAIKPETVFISVMYANNEVGTVQRIAEIGKWIKAQNEKRKAQSLHPIVFHTDACQAAGSLNVDVQKLGVDLMSVNGSKIYGPKQTGFLYARAGISLEPIIYGGGQEKDLRSGTENVPGIVGLAKALELAQKSRQKENSRLVKLRNYFYKQICIKIPDVVLNGPEPDAAPEGGHSELSRLPNNLNVSFLGVDGEALMLYLDSYSICVATGSACTSQSPDPSHVLLAIGRSDDVARGSIRFTLGKQTTKQDLDYVLKVLPGVVAELRRVKN